MSIILKDIVGELLGKGIGFFALLKYLAYLITEKLTETIPMASLIAGIMAAGRLSGDSEITAMRSAGISFPRIYIVFLCFGFLTMIVVAFMNLYIGPMNARARENFESELKAYHSLALVKAGKFMGRAAIDGVSRKGQDIYAEKKSGNILKEVQIREWYNDLNERTSESIVLKNMTIPIGDGFITQIVRAERGELVNRISVEGEIEKVIRLQKGFIIEIDEKQEHYVITDFRKGYMDYALPPPPKALGRLNVRPDNYTFLELLDFLKKMEEGGTVIDICALNPDCNSDSSNVKLGEGKNGDGDGEKLVLPGRSEMDMILLKEKLWLMQNVQRQGEPGGPTRDEMQQHVRIYLMLQGFLKDAEKTRRKFEVEIQKRLAMPLASLLFFFVSFPLGLVIKRTGKGMSFAFAGLVFVLYYLLLSYGLSQAYQGRISPLLGAWIPDIGLIILGIYIMSTRTDDFAPLQFLMRPFYPVLKPIGILLEKGVDPIKTIFRIEIVQKLLRKIKKRDK